MEWTEPRPSASLARTCPDNGPAAPRFEVRQRAGVELAPVTTGSILTVMYIRSTPRRDIGTALSAKGARTRQRADDRPTLLSIPRKLGRCGLFVAERRHRICVCRLPTTISKVGNGLGTIDTVFLREAITAIGAACQPPVTIVPLSHPTPRGKRRTRVPYLVYGVLGSLCSPCSPSGLGSYCCFNPWYNSLGLRCSRHGDPVFRAWRAARTVALSLCRFVAVSRRAHNPCSWLRCRTEASWDQEPPSRRIKPLHRGLRNW